MAAQLKRLAAVGIVFALAGLALGPLPAMLIVGAPSTFAMPVLAAVGDWGAGVRPDRRGARLINSVLIVVVAVLLSALAQLVVGRIDPAGALRGSLVTDQPELPAFPYEIPLGALAFVSFLQLSIVSEGRLMFPARFGPVAGRAAVLLCEVLALVAYLLLANWNVIPADLRQRIGLINPAGPIFALDIATWLIVVSVFQTAYVLLEGWPYALIVRRPVRIAVANLGVLALGSAVYWLGIDVVGVSGPQLAAAGASCIGAQLLIGPLLGLWSELGLTPARRRAAQVVSSFMLAAGLYAGLRALGLGLSTGWTTSAPVQLWIVICGLNLIGGGVLWYTRVIASAANAQVS